MGGSRETCPNDLACIVHRETSPEEVACVGFSPGTSTEITIDCNGIDFPMGAYLNGNCIRWKSRMNVPDGYDINIQSSFILDCANGCAKKIIIQTQYDRMTVSLHLA